MVVKSCQHNKSYTKAQRQSWEQSKKVIKKSFINRYQSLFIILAFYFSIRRCLAFWGNYNCCQFICQADTLNIVNARIGAFKSNERKFLYDS